MSNLADKGNKERADLLRQAADLMKETGVHVVTVRELHTRADAIDPPPDPYEGLDDDQWVEVANPPSGPIICAVETVRTSPGRSVHALIRVVPDGDARDVLVIPVEEAREAVADSGQEGDHCLAILSNAVDKHDERWSS